MKRRTTILIINITIVLLSLSIGFLVLPGTDAIKIALAFYALFLLPGAVLSDLFFNGIKTDFEGVTRVFLMGLSAACFAVFLGFIPGMTYPFIASVYCAGTIAALIWRFASSSRDPRASNDLVGSFTRREEYSSREKKAILALFILIFAICAVVFAGNGEIGISTDAPDHVSFIRRSVHGGGVLPNDSFYQEGDGVSFDPRKGLWHPVASLWAWQADVEPQALWRMIPAFLAFFAIVTFWFFAGELSGSMSIKALSVLFLLLFFRGDGFTWMTKLTYSRNISLIVFWGAAGFMLRFMRNGKREDLATATVATAAGTAVHLVFAPVLVMFMAGLAVYTSIGSWGGRLRGRFWKAVPFVVAAAALPLSVRLTHLPVDPNMIHTHMQGMMDIGHGLRVIDPAELISVMGFSFLFAVLTIPIFPWIASYYERSKMVWVLFSLPVVIILNPLTATLLERYSGYMHIRLLFAAPATVYMAMAVFGTARGALTGRWGREEEKRGLWGRTCLRAAGLLIFAIFAWVFLKPASAALPLNLMHAMRPENNEEEMWIGRMEGILSRIPPGSVVAADPVSSYYISAFTDQYVTVILDQHCSPADTMAVRRIMGARNLFSPLSGCSAILAELERSGAQYLFVDSGRPLASDFFGVNSQEPPGKAAGRFRHCRFLKEVSSNGTMSLFAMDTAPAVSGQEDVHMKANTAESGMTGGGAMFKAVPPIEMGEGIRFESVSFDSSCYSAGDTMHITFCWSPTKPVEFGLPLYWTIRFDTEFEKGPLYRRWYGKQYRRIVERNRGEMYRYTVSGRLSGDSAQPDMWVPGSHIQQEVSIRVPQGMAEGGYSAKVTVGRRAYLPNRTLKDYFLNEDSYDGPSVAEVRFSRDSLSREGGGL